VCVCVYVCFMGQLPGSRLDLNILLKSMLKRELPLKVLFSLILDLCQGQQPLIYQYMLNLYMSKSTNFGGKICDRYDFALESSLKCRIFFVKNKCRKP
jgi:hypothetical protein